VVSTKHLPRYLREWNYRFNRRGNVGDEDSFLLRRAAPKFTIAENQRVAGKQMEGTPMSDQFVYTLLLAPLIIGQTFLGIKIYQRRNHVAPYIMGAALSIPLILIWLAP
jgi:hypothetical protein